jgi:peptidoglycan hydrolase-like protein with peptidoglycan-binding domain
VTREINPSPLDKLISFRSMTIRFSLLMVTPVVLVAATGQQTSNTPSKTSTKAVHKTKKSRYTARKRKPAGPTYQVHPTPDRYKQIQQALADKGYFKGTVDGSWGDDSVDALKRFQTDHHLENDGKINSLSLIQLGLGPKHDGSAITTANPGMPAAPPPVTEAPPEASQSAQ